VGTLWKKLRDRIVGFAAPRLAWWYISFVGATSRVRWIGREHVEALERAGRNFAYAFWHGRQVFFTYSHRGYPAAILVSRSKDGDIIADVMRRSGLRAVRGSSSRGSAAALKELLDAAKAGYRPAITPDGPRGPAREVQPGILFLAREMGIPIIPITNAVRRKIVVRGRDRVRPPHLRRTRRCAGRKSPRAQKGPR